jgi:putative sugar O-methyltransferase
MESNPDGRDIGEGQSLGTPSRFWQRLGSQHLDDLQQYGFEHIKRHQALKYFTWRWGLGSLRGSEQLRFLLQNTPRRALLRALTTPHARREQWSEVEWPLLDRWLYERAVAILWEYALGHGDRQVMALAEPLAGDPLPVFYRGRLISQDLANSALEVAAVKRGLGSSPVESILEVGAGYGRTAYALLNVFPDAEYTIVDIEPALSISRWYLTTTLPHRRLRFVPADQIDEVESGSVDLAVSISSLQEMTEDQVARYISLFDRAAEDGAVFLKQWAEWENPEDGVTLRFDRYPIPTRWSELYSESAPVQTNFRQAMWSVRSGRSS